MVPRRKEAGRRFPLTRVAAGTIMLAATWAAGLYLWIFLFEVADPPFESSTFPEDGAILREYTPTFRWDSLKLTSGFEIENEAGLVVFRKSVTGNEVVVPDGILRAGASYRWRVLEGAFGADSRGRMVLERRFRLANATSSDLVGGGSFEVFPDRLELSLESFVGTMEVDVRCPVEPELTLPAGLTTSRNESVVTGAAGRSVIRMRVDPVGAPREMDDWGNLSIVCSGEVIEVPLEEGAGLGRLVRSRSVGFDVVDDTPGFANFSDSILARMTQGTCVGISFSVKLFFENASFVEPDARMRTWSDSVDIARRLMSGQRVEIRGARNLRDFASKRPELIRQIMSAMHMENFNPANMSATIRASIIHPGPETPAEMDEEMAQGMMPVVGGFRLKARLLKTGNDVTTHSMLDGGHAFLAYRSWQFEKATVYAVYDPNYQYSSANSKSTFLVFPVGGRPTYYIDGRPDRLMMRFVVMSSSDFTRVVGLLATGLKAGVDGVVETIDETSRVIESEVLKQVWGR